MSTAVGKNMPHSPGRKARCKLVTMMTKRSNHMPIVTRNETAKMAAGLVRNFRIQKTWGLTTLQKIMAQ